MYHFVTVITQKEMICCIQLEDVIFSFYATIATVAMAKKIMFNKDLMAI